MRVDAVQVPEVDVVDAEPLQRRVERGAQVLRAAVAVDRLGPLVAARRGRLGGQHGVVAAAAQRLADELLVRERPVDVGRVDELRAGVERAPDDADRGLVVAPRRRVGEAHAHAAEPDGPDRAAGDVAVSATGLARP